MAELSLTVGDKNLTGRFSGLQCSNVDPGGFELLTCQVRSLLGLFPGDRVVLRHGSDVLFYGTLNEPAEDDDGQVAQLSISAVGIGEALKRKPYREIYVDSDLSHWREMGRDRMLLLLNAGYRPGDFQNIVQEDGFGLPSVTLSCNRVSGLHTIGEAWYDAQAIPIGSVFYSVDSYDKGAGGQSLLSSSGGWWVGIGLCQQSDGGGTTEGTGNIAGSGDLLIDGDFGYAVAAVANKTYAVAQVFNDTFAGGADGQWQVFWRPLAVFGRHGIAVSGAAPNFTGLRVSDIARDAFRRSPIALNLVGVQGSDFITYQAAYFDDTMPETVVADMAKLVGWHWGLWEPVGFDTKPTAYFAPVPTFPTVTVDAKRCQQLKVPKVQLDQLYDTCRVKYSEASGTTYFVSVTLDNPYLQQSGISRTLSLDMGIGSAAAARAYGRDVLALSQAAARGSGSALLPKLITDAAGGLRPSCTLKAGRDRIRLRGLPDSALGQLGADNRRYDTFHVRRVELSQDDNGETQTRVEFDGGGDLMEVLQARQQIVDTVTGIG
jgi:hypothetical protein